jgi:hypothetical protein
MKKKILSNPFSIVGLLIIFLYLAILGIDIFVVKNRVDTKSDGVRFEAVGRGKTVEIKPAHDLLNIVILQMKNPGLVSHQDFIFRIIDSSGNILRSINFNGQNIGDPGSVRFQFEPLSASYGKKLRVEVLKADGGDEQIVKVNVASDGSMSYTSYYRTGNKFQNIREVLLSVFNKIIKDYVFIFTWTALLILILVKGYRLK